MRCEKPGCRCYALKEDTFCFWHSEKTAESRRFAGKKGGRRGKVILEDIAIESIEDVKRVLVESLNELRQAGSESITGKARAVGYLCSILISAIQGCDLELRLRALEEQLSQNDKTA